MDGQTAPTLIGFDRASATKSRWRWVRPVIIVLILAALAVGGVLYWLDARQYVTTDDAFIDGDVSQVSAQISGRIAKLMVSDNELVHAGQVLAEIDPRDMQARLDQMVAQRDQAAAQLVQARATVGVREADIAQAAANIRAAQTDLTQAQQDLSRYTRINPRAITQQMVDQARASQGNAQAKLDAAHKAEAGDRAQLEVARAQVAAAQAAVHMADANVEQARLQLEYTQILAPAAGRVARRTVELGNYVSPGQSLLAVVQPDCWVTANLKENQLGRLKPGMHAQIDVDAYPDEKLSAHVQSLQSGTGSVFSSLPVENATGNYVKVVQRLPVKLVFDGDACSRLHLAQGMSVEPSIKVR
jgi:membrane fusion protein (multidrug efflux system)